MQPDGVELQALWRYAGEWWNGEPYQEVRRIVRNGTRREEITLLPSIGSQTASTQKPYKEDNREEVAIRARKIRDEKVAAACGKLPPSYYADRIRESEHRNSGKGYAFGQKVALPSREVRRDQYGMATNYNGIEAYRKPTIGKSAYVPLHVYSGYAYGRGAMLADEL